MACNRQAAPSESTSVPIAVSSAIQRASERSPPNNASSTAAISGSRMIERRSMGKLEIRKGRTLASPRTQHLDQDHMNQAQEHHPNVVRHEAVLDRTDDSADRRGNRCDEIQDAVDEVFVEQRAEQRDDFD